MSYNVTVNGQSTDTTSFEAAKNIVKAGVAAFADSIAKPVRAGLYRSPKTTARVNADRVRSAAKLAGGDRRHPPGNCVDAKEYRRHASGRTDTSAVLCGEPR